MRRIIIFIILILIVLFAYFEISARPMSFSLAEGKATVFVTDIINEVTANYLGSEELNYNDIIIFEKDINGGITAVRTDVLLANRLKSTLSLIILNGIMNLDDTKISIPIGTLSGIGFLNDLGPALSIKLSPVGSVETDIINSFSSAGINQTRHQILMRVKTRILMNLYGRTKTIEKLNDIIIAETIIVGRVPEFFADIGE